ncbi:hypothetical protein Airi01_092470 [Actinoallomurus iriomotensis]|uniref:Uncharacterized protein n=1 Tax=Actinoallomurus iriomotensis TaxID=478107 RepID=A0A9W6RW41_9ACTN|nr:hypothetical protein Airi01_092470 [Actinoallomurus iriomotensis]
MRQPAAFIWSRAAALNAAIKSRITGDTVRRRVSEEGLRIRESGWDPCGADAESVQPLEPPAAYRSIPRLRQKDRTA